MTFIPGDVLRKHGLTLLGVVGMMAGVIGLFLSPEVQRWWFLGGAVCMMATAWAHGERVFLVLQSVVMVAILASFLPVSDVIKGMIPILVFFICLAVSIRNKGFQSPLDWFGAASLFILSLGYAVQHYILFIIAGSMLCVFSWFEIQRGFKAAWLWFLLNLAFVFSAFINL